MKEADKTTCDSATNSVCGGQVSAATNMIHWGGSDQDVVSEKVQTGRTNSDADMAHVTWVSTGAFKIRPRPSESWISLSSRTSIKMATLLSSPETRS